MVSPTLSQFSKVSKFHTPSGATTSLVEPLLTSCKNSSLPMVLQLKVVNQPGTKSSEKSRRKYALLPLTLQRPRKTPAAPTLRSKNTHFQTNQSSRSTHQDSVHQKVSSSQTTLLREVKSWVSTK